MNALKAMMEARKAAAEGGGQQAQAAPQSPQESSKVDSEVEKPKNLFAQRFGAKPNQPEPSESIIDGDDLDLSDLSEMEETIVVDHDPNRIVKSQFADELPASAPARQLPEDIDKSGIQFVALCDQVYGLVDDPELLGNVIRGIMVELKSHPQYMKMVSKDDVRLWVKSMRDSMGLARIKKQEKKTTRGTAASAKGGKGMDKDMLDAFNDLGVNLDNL